MSWTEDQVEKKDSKKEGEVKTEAKAESSTAPVVEEKVETKPAATEEPKTEPVTEPKEPEARFVRQEIVGKVAKSLREKGREKDDRIRALEEENKKLRESVPEPDPIAKEEDERIALKVRTEFLKQENVRGRRIYGQAYQDALDLVASQKDPSLANRIQWADNPVEALMDEAARIAENVEYGPDPIERERKKEQALEAKVRKKVEAEFAEKLKARNNQPTDVQNVRAAGGNDTSNVRTDTWETSLPR